VSRLVSAEGWVAVDSEWGIALPLKLIRRGSNVPAPI